MEKLIEIKNFNNSIYVYWILTDFCNQHCTYCPPSLNNATYANKPNFITDADIDRFIDKLIDTKKKTQKKLIVGIAGGEPTTHNKFPDIVKRLRDYASIEVVTNGTRSVKWWSELPALPDLTILSLHPEYYDAKKIKINELCDFLVGNNKHIQFNLMCHPTMWDKTMSMFDDINGKYKQFIIPKIIHNMDNMGISYNQEKEVYNYSVEQLNFIKNHQYKIQTADNTRKDSTNIYADATSKKCNPNALMAQGQHYFKNWKCSAGSEGISVSPDGKILAGICGAKQLGTMQTTFEFLDDYLDCPKVNCVCPGDIALNKYNPIFTKQS
jgi:MoaA/NifB/PqqE/SkfB family radical SAM enzyme